LRAWGRVAAAGTEGEGEGGDGAVAGLQQRIDVIAAASHLQLEPTAILAMNGDWEGRSASTAGRGIQNAVARRRGDHLHDLVDTAQRDADSRWPDPEQSIIGEDQGPFNEISRDRLQQRNVANTVSFKFRNYQLSFLIYMLLRQKIQIIFPTPHYIGHHLNPKKNRHQTLLH